MLTITSPGGLPIDKSFRNCVTASICVFRSSLRTPCTRPGRLSSCTGDAVLSTAVEKSNSDPVCMHLQAASKRDTRGRLVSSGLGWTYIQLTDMLDIGKRISSTFLCHLYHRRKGCIPYTHTSKLGTQSLSLTFLSTVGPFEVSN
jgi:hypothetical protein